MGKHPLLNSKHTGVMIPLFSMNSKDDFGIGDISSLMQWLEVIRAMGFDILQILPINEMPPKNNCPYTSITAFGIDPVYISIKDVENLSPDIKKKLNSKEFRKKIKELRKKDYIDYDEIKTIKFGLLWEQYNYFTQTARPGSSQAAIFEAYKKENAYWLEDYAVFRRLKDIKGWTSWTHWEEPLKSRDHAALEQFREKESYNIDFFKYIQWEIDKQWRSARNLAQKYGIKFFGDIPFMVNQESADIWSRQGDFRIDMEIGAPPDAFSQTGQKWGLPAYNWSEMERNNFQWWQMKLKKFADFYDIFRIDHMVGFFRTWIIPRKPDQKPDFDILNPHDQENRGRNFLKAVIPASVMLPIAEDLGVIPDYVHKVLSELSVCGYKVLRWEKDKDGNYRSPESFDPVSFTTTSTHDSEPMALWWDRIDKVERDLFWKMISSKKEKAPPSYAKARNAVVSRTMKAASALVVFPIQDLTASKERVNEPNTIGSHNWAYRLKEDPVKFLRKNGKLIAFLKKSAAERHEKK